MFTNTKRVWFWLALLCWVCISNSNAVSFRGSGVSAPQQQDETQSLLRRRRAMEDKEKDAEEEEEDNIFAPTDAPTTRLTSAPTARITEAITTPTVPDNAAVSA